MKTTTRARKVLKLQHRVIVLAFLLLVSVGFWMGCRLGHCFEQASSQPPMPVLDMSNLFAAR